MLITRYRERESGRRGVGIGDQRCIHPLPGTATLAEMLRLPADDLRAAWAAPAPDGEQHTLEYSVVDLLAPVDGRTDVWAAGVTYRRSRQARVEESERSADVYERVYDADRPELFFKATAWRVRGHQQAVSIRADSAVNVPEPELAVVANRFGEIVGYTVCDDVSSRSIEGENPLYLPQAKAYLGACAVGPGIRPAWEVPDPYALGIAMTIARGGEVAWSGRASTADLHRKLEELVAYLFRADAFPDGVVLSTGTCLVPDLPFTLQPGDEVTISIDDVGTLSNPVVRGKEALLADVR